ncbi:hypothetical protein HK096_003163 [Nowakowskiella sp. JEL0078]|nr:hypothetical protein HK096_003163 [Nowakowskiella sp. JEL0078]
MEDRSNQSAENHNSHPKSETSLPGIRSLINSFPISVTPASPVQRKSGDNSLDLSSSVPPIPIPGKTHSFDPLDAFSPSFSSGSSYIQQNSQSLANSNTKQSFLYQSSSNPSPPQKQSFGTSLGSFSPPNSAIFKKQQLMISSSKIRRSSVGNRTNFKKSQSTSFINKNLDPRELLMSVNSLVKNRAGSVLARQTILKNDHFEHTLNEQLDFYIQGAPNFRMCDLSIYGVAQPSVSGISSILALLKCHPMSGLNSDSPTCIWLSAREEPIVYINNKPFVLREEQTPFQNRTNYQGISAERLERLEERLKDDVAREAERCGGLVLVHDESNGRVVPTWTCADLLQTSREVFDEFRAKGYRVKYFRLPISPEQAPEDRYLDDYLDIIRATKSEDPLVFNCGVGVGRTTFAIVAATIVRRAKIFHETKSDPIPVGKMINLTNSQNDLWNIDDTAEMQNRAILRLVYLLEKGLSSKVEPGSAIHWALARGPLIEDLKNAVMGNYQCILQLASVLRNGSHWKKLLDAIINRSFVGENYADTEPRKFSEWFTARPEVTSMLHNLRRKGARLYLFRPVEDLSVLSEAGLPMNGKYSSQVNRPIANELEKQVIKLRQGIVLVQHTILKVDHWMKEQGKRSTIEGASNFRKIPGLNVYGVAQPTIQGMKNVLDQLQRSTETAGPSTVIWINLREEPLIYVNGVPFVLRDQYFTLRNITSYSGITSSRLELIELRLKSDVCAELANYDNKILLHGETSDGEIVPQWEDCQAENVLTIKEVVEDVLKREKLSDDPNSFGEEMKSRISYFRVPITAEMPPDEADFDHLVSIVTKKNAQATSFVLNCQVGLSRSTSGTVIVGLVLHWLNGTRPSPPQTSTPRLNYQLIHSLLRVIKNGLECKKVVDDMIDQCSQFVNLRESIESCQVSAEQAPAENPLPSAANSIKPSKISESNFSTGSLLDLNPMVTHQPIQLTRKRQIKRGLLQLKRYFMLIAFQSYLDSNPPKNIELGSLESFKSWMKKYPEFNTMLQEFEIAGLEALTPVEKMTPGDGIALTSEVLDVVNSRNGSVLAKQTILKYDMFPGCQKLSLPERIDGAPNFRQISFSSILRNLFQMLGEELSPVSATIPHFQLPHLGQELDYNLPPTEFNYSVNSDVGFSNSVCGSAMPTMDGIRSVLKKLMAVPNSHRQALWTSLREEPVVYVNGRPFVLRLFQDAIKNIEATGIARERVEEMETRMKMDIVAELQLYNGRILLHEEEVNGNNFSIVPVWETVREEDVQTPKEVFQSIKDEGYRVDYLRIPITDEQAPIPDVFNQLVDRLLKLDENTDALFNCQMGRGRTTTGMAVACLIEMIVGNSFIFDISEDYIAVTGTENSDDIHQRYQNGDYKMILQLIAVLQYGKLAKRLTDSALDACEHLQNLRVAIFDYKLRVEALPIGSKKYNVLLEVALNYLIRYFYLITFAAYLLEEMTNEEWMRTRVMHSEDKNQTHIESPVRVFDVDEGDISVPGTDTMSMGSNSRDGESPTLAADAESFSSIGRKHPRIKFSDWLLERREITNLVRHENQSLD